MRHMLQMQVENETQPFLWSSTVYSYKSISIILKIVLKEKLEMPNSERKKERDWHLTLIT